MSLRKPAPVKAPTNGKATAGLELTYAQVLDAAEAMARLLKVPLPSVLSLGLHQRYQVLKFVAGPVLDADKALAERFTKKDRKGKPVLDNGRGVLRDKEKYWRERADLMATKTRVKVEPLERDTLPEKVDGKPVVVAGEVWELLGPLLTN